MAVPTATELTSGSRLAKVLQENIRTRKLTEHIPDEKFNSSGALFYPVTTSSEASAKYKVHFAVSSPKVGTVLSVSCPVGLRLAGSPNITFRCSDEDKWTPVKQEDGPKLDDQKCEQVGSEVDFNKGHWALLGASTPNVHFMRKIPPGVHP